MNKKESINSHETTDDDREKYIKENMESYQRDALRSIIVGENMMSRIDIDARWEINNKRANETTEKMKDEKEEEINALREKKIEEYISSQREKIKKILGREISDEEIIYLKEGKGVELATVSVFEEDKGEIIELWIVEKGKGATGKTGIRRSEIDGFIDGKLDGKDNYFANKKKEFEDKWAAREDKDFPQSSEKTNQPQKTEQGPQEGRQTQETNKKEIAKTGRSISEMMRGNRPAVTDSVTRKEEAERFELDRSAFRVLGGAIEGKWDKLLIDAARAALSKNPRDFRLTPEAIQGLTNTQIREMVTNRTNLQEAIMNGDMSEQLKKLDRCGEVYRRAEKRGWLDPSEKIFFLKNSEEFLKGYPPEMLKNVRARLWESMTGKNIEEEAIERSDQGEKEEYVRERMKNYTEEKICSIMTKSGDIEEIDSKIEREIVGKEIDRINEEKKQKGEDVMNGDKEKKERIKIRKEKKGEISTQRKKEIENLVSVRKKEIVKKLGREVTDEEIIFLEEKGIDLTETSSGWSLYHLGKVINLGSENMRKGEIKEFLNRELVGKDDYFAEKRKEFGDDWTNKIDSLKEKIIQDSLSEIEDDLLDRIYEEKVQEIIPRVGQKVTPDQERGSREIRETLNPEVVNSLIEFLGNMPIGKLNRKMDFDSIRKRLESFPAGTAGYNLKKRIGEEGSKEREKFKKELARGGGGMPSILSLLLGLIFIYPIIAMGKKYGEGKN